MTNQERRFATTAYYSALALSVNGALRYTLIDGLGSVSATVDPAIGTVTGGYRHAACI